MSSQISSSSSDFKIIEQTTKLPVNKAIFEESRINSSSSLLYESSRILHGPLFPDSIRGLIVGKSGCGKTNLVITLLHHKNGLKFENVYLISKETINTLGNLKTTLSDIYIKYRFRISNLFINVVLYF